MSQSGNGGYNGLKAFAFTVGVTVLIFIVLYLGRRYNPNLFVHEPFSRSYSWYLRGPDNPPETESDRQRRSLGERPRMWDVWIASWYPPYSQPDLPSERLGPGKGEGEKHDVSCAADGEKKPQWTEFLPLSADKVSDVDADADTVVSLSQPKGDNPVQSTSSTQIQINTVILMPAPPRPTSLPSTSTSHDTYGPPREYVFGSSYISYAPGD